MRCFITRINGFTEPDLEKKQQKIADSANKNGFLDMAFYVYDGRMESRESRYARYDGIIAGVKQGDIAIVQIPTGNGHEWDMGIINHLKTYGVKIITFLHDLVDHAPDERRGSSSDIYRICNASESVIASTRDIYQKIVSSDIKHNVFFYEGCNCNSDETYLNYTYYTNKVIMLAVESVLSNGDVNTFQVLNDTWRDIGSNTVTYSVAREAYGGKHAISYRYEGNSDGIIIRNKHGIVFETQNRHEHYALIPSELAAEPYNIEAYICSVEGKTVIASSKDVYLDDPVYNDADPLVSIVIPAYNSASLIGRTIDNILAQSQRDIELVVVDDGSTDGTAEVIKWYAKRYLEVKLFQKENGGQASARNYGIRQARGKYIGFADNDDMLPVDAIELLYNSIVENEADIACGNAEQLTRERRFTLVSYPDWGKVISAEQYLHDNIWVVIWNKLYKAEICKKSSFGPKIGEDNAWTPVAISYADKISYVNKTVYEWDQSRETQNASWLKLPIEVMEDAFEKMIMDTLEKYNVEKTAAVKEYLIKTCNMNKGRYGNTDELIERIQKYNRT